MTDRGSEKLGEAVARAMASMSALGPEREAEWREQQARDEAFERATKRATALEPVRAQLPPAVFNALVREQNLAATEAIAAVQRWLSDRVPVLALSGNTGCGKTVAMAYALAATGGLWITCAQLTRRSQANFGDEAEEYERTLRARVLLLDDVGTERLPADAVASMLVELLEKRGGLRTILTTNLSFADFVKRYSDARLRSRLSRIEWVGCDGEDMRRAK